MIYVVQGSSVVKSFPMAYGRGDSEGALAVSQTIRTRASDLRSGTDLGAGEYTLSGIPTGVGYATPATGNLRYYDGTSDGFHNYFVDHGQNDPLTGGVYRTDYYWQTPEFLFSPFGICNNPSPPGCWGLSGIAYDPNNSSLWVSAKGSTMIQDYALNGTLLTEFDAPDLAGYNAALGFDQADNTLWMTTGGSNILRQYSVDPATFGQLEQRGIPLGLPAGLFEAADFQETPEPASFVFLVSILLSLAVLSASPRRWFRPDRF
jgi:hypothetical protein